MLFKGDWREFNVLPVTLKVVPTHTCSSLMVLLSRRSPPLIKKPHARDLNVSTLNISTHPSRSE